MAEMVETSLFPLTFFEFRVCIEVHRARVRIERSIVKFQARKPIFQCRGVLVKKTFVRKKEENREKIRKIFRIRII